MTNRKPILPFNEWLREELEVTGMTQMKLALACGMNQGAISAYVTGHIKPSAENMARVLEAFGKELCVRKKDWPADE